MKVSDFNINMESTRKELCRLLQTAGAVKASKKVTDGIKKAINGAGTMLGDIHSAMGHKSDPPKYDGKERLYNGPILNVTKQNKDTVKANLEASLSVVKEDIDKYFHKDHVRTHMHVILADNTYVKIKKTTKAARTSASNGLGEAIKAL